MIEISCRKNFTDATDLAPLQFRASIETKPPVGMHGANWTHTYRTITEQELLALCAGKRVCILIHGYKNAYEDALGAYLSLEQAVGDAYDEVIGFYWPGSWARVGFRLAMRRANRAGSDYLAVLLLRLQRVGATIDIQTHSLGARVACAALNDTGPVVRNLILSAPAIDDDSFGYERPFERASRAATRIHVAHSERDDVLRYAYLFGSFFGQAMGLGGSISTGTPNVTNHDFTASVGGHGEYKASGEYLKRWREWAV